MTQKQQKHLQAAKTLQAVVNRKNETTQIINKAIENITIDQHEQLADEYAKIEEGNIIESQAKRAAIGHGYNDVKHELDANNTTSVTNL